MPRLYRHVLLFRNADLFEHAVDDGNVINDGIDDALVDDDADNLRSAIRHSSG